jgi:hypothetical protein
MRKWFVSKRKGLELKAATFATQPTDLDWSSFRRRFMEHKCEVHAGSSE